MKIAGVWSGHDCSFCVFENGKPEVHAELERYNREKSPKGDSINFLFERMGKECDDVEHFISVHPKKKIIQHENSFEKALEICKKNGGDFHFISHHKAHAANAFYSSNLSESLVITLDGGGVEDDRGGESACTVWLGKEKTLKHLKTFRPYEINIGGVWTRVTRYIFRLNNGWPLGGQEGSVMAMAALGDSQKYFKDFQKMLIQDILPSSMKPKGQPDGPTTKDDPTHPYLDPWVKIADSSEQEKYNLAAGLQAATEWLIKEIVGQCLQETEAKNLCLSGGVALNSVAMGKLFEWFPQVENIYIPPVPYDGGLCLGAVQWLWHEKLGNDRIKWDKNFTPYLGEQWSDNDVIQCVTATVENGRVTSKNASIDDVISLLEKGEIVSVFNEGSESGRRALGNRSILADPRKDFMKDRVNEKVKHRQWYRPFAPSILRSEVDKWFVRDVDSAYMQFVIKFKPEMGAKVPAVNHFDGTARLQTVEEEDNKWYFDFLTKWNKSSGVPIILNTSFNDREPICENPQHAMNCFMSTDIDHLYFCKENLLVSKT
jgi:carbamoyltransferase